jgi:hypothetical protein
MLADQLDYIVGVDPHRDSHALAVLHVISGAVVFEAAVSANSEGYAQALELVDQHAAGRRAFAVEGTGSFGAGLTRFLTGQGERVLEVSRLRRERRSGGKRPTRSIARRVLQLTAEERELAREIETLTRRLAPQLLDQPGVGPHAAAQLTLSWSHQGRITSEGRVRDARRRSPNPRLLRPDHPLPPRPKRRPQTQPRTPHDPRHTETLTPRDDRLHPTTHPGRQDPTRSKPLPQARPRPHPLPAPRAPANDDLTFIEASQTQPVLFSRRISSRARS